MAAISRRQQQQQQQQRNHHHPHHQNNFSTICSYLIASIQIVLVVLAGSICGFVVAALQAFSFHDAEVAMEIGAATTATTNSRSLSNNNNNDNNNCRMPPKTTKLTITSNDLFFDLVVWDDGDFLTETIKNTGVWEILNIQGVAELGEAKMPETPGVFWDVGANVGYYSFLFAAAGYTVVAMEPEGQNAALFRASLCLNPNLASRMTLLQTAVTSTDNMLDTTTRTSSDTKKCRIVATTRAKRMKQYLHLIPRLVCSGSEGKCRRGLVPDSICQDVAVTTLDTILKSYAPPNILKLDVEGHELAVLKGGQTLLANAQKAPSIIQYENKDGRVEGEIAILLESYGYRIGTQRGHDSNTVASKTSV